MRPTALSPRPIVEPMEARILHSADLAPLALAAVATETLVQQPVRSEAAVQRSEIVFVDASLPDAAELVADLQAQRGAGRSIEIVTFAAGADGLALIGETLATRHDIAAVHVLAHGSDGRLQLGSTVLDAQTLLRRAGELAAWGDALTADADLLLYGCDLAQDAGEQQLVRDLAALTGADVAASTDLTGAASRGGNWTLEYATGRIEAALAPSVQEQAQWQGVLATYAVTNTGDVVGATLLPGTLRWAISQANANAGADRIVFAVNGTFNSASLGIGDDRNVSGDFDITDSVDIVGNGSANTVINGNGADRVFDIRNGTVTLSGLTVQGGRSDAGGGVRINPAGRATLTDVVVQNNVGNGATLGAGIYNNGILTLNRVLVRNNGDLLSGAAAGAGVYNDIATTLDARDVEIRDNVSTGLSGGGGMTLARNTTATLQNVTIAGNRGESGGGLKNQSSRASLVDVTLSGNRAVSDGGGLWSDRAITLDHVTIAGNTAVSGGGVFDAGTTVTARNSLFSGNAGGNTNKALISQGYNLSDDGSAGFTGAGDRSNTPAGLLALADNGGFTRTRALGAGSAAVDAADPLPASGTDQRGMAVYGGRADIGAYEYTPYGFAPTIGAIADQTVAEDGTLGPLAFTVGDIESGAAGVVVIATSSNTALVPNAAIVLGGSGSSRTVSLTPAANANSAVNGGPATITLSVSDGSNVTRTAFTITVQAVNDAPALTLPAAQPVAEDGALVFSGANGNALAAADADAGSAPLQLTLAVANGTLTLGQTSGLAFVTGSGSDNASMTFSGSQSAINAALAGLRYRPRADYSGSDRLDLNINDLGGSGSGGARSAAGSVAIAVNAVNDAPVLGLPGAQSTPQPAPLSFSAAAGNAITVADIDAGAAPLQLSLSTANLQANGTLSFGRLTGLTLLVGTGTNDTVVLLRGSAADLNAALDTLTFQATAPGAARIDIALDDLGNSGSGGAAQAGGAVAISVGNDSPPVLTLGHATRTYTEGDGPIKLDPSLGLADSDNATLASARVRIGPGYAGTEGVLAFANNRATMGNIAGSYGAGVLTLTSAGQTATVAEWEQALASVTYVDASTAPSTAPRTVTLTVNDGIADSAARQIVVSVVPANDAPLLTGANDFRPIAEDTTENHGTLVSTLIAGHLTDADSPALAGIAVVGVGDAMGRWQYTTDGGIHWNAFGTVGDGAARLLAADADSAVRFVPAPDWNGTVADGLRFRAWDLTTSSAGDAADSSVNGDRTAFSAGTAASSVTVTPVNDAPVLAGAIAKQSATQDQPYAFTLAAGTFTDIDAGDTVSYVATLASGAALPPWLSFDAATQRFSGTPANADVGPTTLRVTATDASGASAFCDFALAVADVDDAPVLAAAVADQSVLAGTALRFDIPPATFADPDAGDTLRYAATLADGTALPRWLNFDATAPGFAATPSAADAGRVAVRLTATDRAGASAQALFTITVSAPDAPAPVPAMPPPVVGVPAAADVPVVESPAPTVPVVDATALPPAGTVPPAAAVPVVATPAPLPAANPSPAPTVPVADAVAPLPVVKALPLLATPVVDAAAPLPTFKAAPAETIASADLPSLSKPATAAYTATAVPVELSLLAGPAPVPVSDALPSPVAAFGPAEAPHRTAMVVIDPVATPIHAAIRSDALLPTMTAPQFADTMIAPLMQLLRSDELMRKLQETERYALVQHEARRTAMASSVVVTGGLSIGYVVWLVRGGVLMSSMLSALPAWQMVDPLPVLAAARPSRKAARDDDDRDAADDREVERLFDERAARGQRDAVPPACAGAPGLPAVSGEPRR